MTTYAQNSVLTSALMNALDGRVVAVEAAVPPLTTRVTTVEGTLPNLASATSLTALTSRVTAAETNITNRATTTTVNALTTRVSSVEATIPTLATNAALAAETAARLAAIGGSSSIAIVTSYGAIGDGASHPLSATYASLAAAQAVYPHATSLTQERDWAGIQAALNAMNARGERGGRVHVPNVGTAYRINETLTYNPRTTSLIGENATLDFSSMAYGKNGFLVKADGSPTYGHSKNRLQGFELIGPGANGAHTTTTACFKFDTLTVGLSSRLMLADLAIHDWPRAVQFLNRAYLDRFINCDFYQCTECVHFGSGADAGEMLSFVQCCFFNSDVALWNEIGGGMNFFGCSFDYNGVMLKGMWGENRFVACHFEHGAVGVAQIEVNGGCCSFVGCWYLNLSSPLAFGTFKTAAGATIQWSAGRASGLGTVQHQGAGVFHYSSWTTIAPGTGVIDTILGG